MIDIYMNIYHNLQQTALEEIKSVDNIIPYFTRVTDVDDSPDLTDIHPRERTDMDLHFIAVEQNRFPRISDFVNTISGVRSSVIIGLGPQSQLYPHVDTVELPPYSYIDWVSVFIGLFVPSYDKDLVAVKIGNQIFDHREILFFDTQIPHSAWNWTDEWWISIRLSVDKKFLV